jgi:hypothetical protein
VKACFNLQSVFYDLLLSERVEHVECADSALDLSEAITRYHDDLDLPPSVSLFFPLFEFEPRCTLRLTSESLGITLADGFRACGSSPNL